MTNQTFTQEQRTEIVDALMEAQEKFREVIKAVEQYINATGDRNAKAYWLDHAKIMAGSGHGFLSRDLNLDNIIERAQRWETHGTINEDEVEGGEEDL